MAQNMTKFTLTIVLLGALLAVAVFRLIETSVSRIGAKAVRRV